MNEGTVDRFASAQLGLPLSSPQRVVWLDELRDPGGTRCVISVLTRLEGEIDALVLERAARIVATRHDALRLRLCTDDNSRQEVLPEVAFQLKTLDLSESTGAEAEIFARLRSLMAQPIDPKGDRLWDVQLVRTGQPRCYLIERYHHLIVDGHGAKLVHNALADEYTRLLGGVVSSPEAGPPYAQYIEQDDAYQQSERFRRDRAFWFDRFKESPDPLIPSSRTEGVARTAEQCKVGWRISRARFQRMEAYCATHGCSPTHMMLALLAAYFARTEDVSDIVIGLAVHNRAGAWKRTVGMFASVVPLRIPIDCNDSFAGLMRECDAQLQRCYRHQRFPMDELARHVRSGTADHRRTYDLTVSIEHLDVDRDFGPAPSKILEIGRGVHTPLAIHLQDYHATEDVQLEIYCDGEAVGAQELAILKTRLVRMLDAVLDGGQGPIRELPLMSEAERHQVVVEFNATSAPYPADKRIHELFEAQVDNRPDAVAVVHEDGLLSYAELDRRANQLAWYLRELGARSGDLIPIVLARGLDLVIAELAVLKCDCAYVPVDPEYPLRRQELIIRDCSASIVLAMNERPADLAIAGPKWVDLRRARERIAGCRPERLPREPAGAPASAAYVMFTSGSTGEPKGVVVRHHSISRLVIHNGYVEIDPSDCIAHSSHPAFDASTFEVWGALLNGARLLIVPHSTVLQSSAFVRQLQEHGVTILFLTPSLFNHCAALGEPVFHRFKCVIMGGESPSVDVVRRVLREDAPQQLLNGYGPTETTTFATSYRIEPLDGEVQSVPIGRPIANTRVYILDRYGAPVPIGVSGEICIGGAGVASGYLNRPELTAAAFVRDPFDADPNARLYKSGDRGRWRPDGVIEFLGRNDQQVKIRGFRIEPGEIEAQLRDHPHVGDAVVVMREHEGEKRLVAYVTPSANAPVTAEALRAHLDSALPGHMVPGAFVVLDSFPLTASGKLDRKSLLACQGQALERQAYEPPHGEIEQALAAIWQEVLKVERVGRHDHFLELGGHSLRAAQVLTRVGKTLGREIALRDIFEAASVAKLARRLEASNPARQSAIEPADRSAPLYLSMAQQRLWFIDRLEGSVAFHIPAELRLRGILDATVLQSALSGIIARHEILRTVFRGVRGVAEQVIHPPERFPLPCVDLSALAFEERERQRQQCSYEEAHAPFDLGAGPLIRARLLRLADDDHVLLMTMHHIVSDGWSMNILLRELIALYSAYRDGRSGALPPLPAQYVDYAQWQRRLACGEGTTRHLDYWTRHLSNAPALLELPTDRMRPSARSFRGDTLEFSLGVQLSASLKGLCRGLNVTLFMVLYAGWAVLMSRLSGQDDVVIGTAVADRQRPELEELIGFFVNMLALRVRLRDELSVRELLSEVKELTLTGYAHGDAPFEQVVEAVRPPRNLGHTPLFQTLLVLQNTPWGEWDLPDLKISASAVPQKATQFDLVISLQEKGQDITGTLSYATDLFDRGTVERWIRYFRAVLGAMASDAGRPVCELDLLDAAERAELAERANATSTRYPDQKLIQELFEEQVAARPDAVAVVYEGEELTYAELNRRANQLAHYLRHREVTPDQRVAVCLERNREVIVTLLGILKAGAAYVPLDPAYPAARLAYIVRNAAPSLVLTQEHLTSADWWGSAERVSLDTQRSEIALEPGWNPSPRSMGLTSSHLAYVIYTSGSTGEPKGVMIAHRSVCNLIQAQVASLLIEPESRVLSFASLSFDAFVWEAFSTLCTGATLLLAPRGEAMAGLALHGMLRRGRISHVTLPPAVIATLPTEPDLPNLKTLVSAGEACPQSLVRDWAAGRRFINAYGPTETTVCASLHVCEAGSLEKPPIGRAIQNARIYVLDRNQRLVPPGAVGEIHIGGVGVGRGYLGRPALTAERFIADPISETPGARLYRSGDLGRWRGDGTLEYVERNDHQVKIRGYRVELGEIEAQFRRHADVRDAAVLLREDAGGDKRLVAYLVLEQPGAVGVEELRTHVKAVLPEYMVPSAIVVLESMPLTENGKLDRRALPMPDRGAYATREYEAPEGGIERSIARVWQELLRVDRAGRHDNFFELGGHSLRIVELIERLQRLGLHAEVRQLYENPTLAGLASVLSQAGPLAPQPSGNTAPPGCTSLTAEMLPLVELRQEHIDQIVRQVPEGAGNVQDVYPLTPLQEGILFHHLLGERSDAYVLPVLLSVDSEEQLECFVRALQVVVDRHDVLRTLVLWKDLPGPVQVVLRRVPLALERVELSPDCATSEQVEAWMAPESQWIDLQQAPLLRLRVARDPCTPRWYVRLQVHHIATDHVALEYVLEEVRACLEGRQNELPQPSSSRDHVARVLELARGSDAEEFFRGRLGDVTEPTAPFGLLNVRGDGSQIGEAEQWVEERLGKRVQGLARDMGMSPAALFHAAWALVVARASGRDDVVFGSVLSGRLQHTMQGAGRVLGMFINTLPLRLRLAGLTASETVRHAQQELLKLLKYEHASLAAAQRASGLPGSAPLFSAILNYRHTRETDGAANDVFHPDTGIHVLSAYERNNYPITLNVDVVGERFRLTAQTDLRVSAKQVTRYLHTALAALADALESASRTPVQNLSILPEDEREQLLHGFNATQAEYPRKTLPELFEEQVDRTPNAVAVVCDGEQLTYAELNSRANQLARHLRRKGAGPDVPTALCVERSLHMVVGLLGILKAGGAYVPLDATHPPDRIAYTLRDAAPGIVVSQAHLRSRLPEDGPEIVALDAQWADVAREETANLQLPELTCEHLAYVIYTSGSTGAPKGVMVSHAAVVNFLSTMREKPGMGPGDCMLAVTTLSFDIAGLEIYLPLLQGARLVIASSHAASNAQQLMAAIEDSGATILQATPVTWRLLLAAGWPGRRTLKALCGGEALTSDLSRQLVDRVGELWNLYGPTETTIWSCKRQISHAGGSDPSIEPIGSPLANTRIYVLDAHHQPVLPGVAGEIHIGGDGVARGYLGRPALTAERFIADPFGGVAGARLYRTGDLGRWRPDGTLEFVGRNDHQVKVRGVRIELGEIESTLRKHPLVGECVVVARDFGAADKRLVGYVTPRKEEQAAAEAGDRTGFSLFYFGAETGTRNDKYELYVDAARFADANGFEAVWTPERHFDSVGGLYANPSVLSAALATITQRIQLRAGSVVLPLHEPIRVAEEWSVVDNLSSGRVGLAIASGWHPRDFVLAAANFAARRERVREGITELRTLWNGGSVTRTDGAGKSAEVCIFPAPVQPRLPLWLTAAGNPETFVEAGRLGTHVLTHLLGQTIEELSEKITLYRDTLAANGHPPNAGRVTLMVHTYLGPDLQQTLERARGPFLSYMKSHLGLQRSFFRSAGIPIEDVAESDLDEMAQFAFQRYARTAALIGTPQSVLGTVNRLQDAGVDEIACLIDWMDHDETLAGLPHLRELKERAARPRPTARKLMHHCKTWLPDYMIPSVYVCMEALPLTANGKIDRNALPAPQVEDHAVAEYEPPLGEMETALAGLWQQVLGLARVGRCDNFFDLGGHSLLAMRLAARVRSVLHRELALTKLFDHPTLQELARELSLTAGAPLEPIARADRNRPLTLSMAQQRLWFIDRLEGTGAAYHIAGSVRLKGKLDQHALQAALDTILTRHEVLRTTFVHIDSAPIQVIASDAKFVLQPADLSDLPDEERRAEIWRQTREEAQSRFDLSTGPLFRGRLLRLGDDEHVLLLTMHHIVSDGLWSLAIVVRELSALYRAYSVGGENPLPDLPIQYADYAQWQRQWLVGEVLQKQLAYWKEQLADAPALLALPTDRARPVERSYRGESVELSLGQQLTASLNQLCRECGITPFMALFAGLAVVMSRLSGQDDVVIGTSVANRPRAELEGLVGFFVSNLALRVRMEHGLTIRHLLDRVRQTTLDAYAHQDVPFEQVVETVQPPRTLGHSPIFQVLLVLGNVPLGEVEFPGLDATLHETPLGASRFDLTLTLIESRGELAGNLTYSTELFDRSTVVRWIGYLKTALAAMVENPDQTVGAVALLSAMERHRVIRDFNATAAELPSKTLHVLFEEQARSSPDAPALICKNLELSYAQLNQRANQLAHWLRASGVGLEDRVALFMERSADLVIGVLAAMKAGASYVPLDPRHPAEHLAFLLADSAAKVVLTQDRLSLRLPAITAHVVAVDAQSNEIAAQPSENPQVPALTARHVAYVMYTSGSTGRPKAVMVEHGNVVNYALHAARQFAVAEGDGSLIGTSMCFDLSLTGLYPPLLCGRPVTLCPEEDDLSEALLSGQNLSPVKLTPTHLRLLSLVPERVAQCVRTLVVGGEPLQAGAVRWWREHSPQTRIFNHYGPTETTIGCVVHELSAEVDGPVPIGKPITNTQVYILDRYLAPVPIGAVGEIYIGGAGVARGYLNRPGLTAACFLPDPFSTVAPARIYKSGDLGRWRPDGTIEYLGREDQQVKIRGYRIELEEIEAQLRRHPQVKEAVTLVREDDRGEKRLVAYIVFQPDGAASVEALREHLKGVLPEYMVPSEVVTLESLPMTANGKLDRQALLALESHDDSRKEHEPPQGEVEEMLAAIWRQLLPVDRVGRHDDFFDLGGHSLLAVQLLARIRRCLGREVPLRDVFDFPTLSALARQLLVGDHGDLPPIRRVNRTQPLALSLSQQRLWFVEQLESAGSAYHMAGGVRLRGSLDREALQASLNAIIERHEVLRTTFVNVQGVPVQIISPEVTFALSFTDLEGLATRVQEARVHQQALEEAQTRFDLATGPLIRGRLLRLSNEEHVLLFTMHHIVSDDWSGAILVRELTALYHAFIAGAPNPLPELRIQYADYAQWQRQSLSADVLQAQLNYWKQQLAGAPVLLDLPTARPRPETQSYRGARVSFSLDAALTTALQALCRRCDVTLFMGLYAGWALVLSRLSGQDDVVIGTSVSHRGRTELEPLIGFFLSNLALRVRLDGEARVQQLLSHVRESALGGYANQDVPFEQVVEALQPTRTLSHSPLFQAIFVMRSAQRSELRLPGLTLAPLEVPSSAAKFDLFLSMQESGERLMGDIDYASDLFDRATIERWIGYFRNVLQAMVTDAGQKIGALNLLDAAERTRIIQGFNAAAVEDSHDLLVHELFEEQVRRSPDAVAVIDRNERFSYTELNERANQLAHYLMEQGVGPDDRVAVCMERDALLVVGLLGILKSGAAYVPLDPAYPAERLEYLIADAAPKVILTQERLVGQVRAKHATRICLDALSNDLLAFPGRNPQVTQLFAAHLAYVVYTSGSSGAPKAVAAEHRATVHRLMAQKAFDAYAPSDVCCQKTAIGFVDSIFEILGPLTHGVPLAIAPTAATRDVPRLASFIQEQQITRLITVPSLARSLLECADCSRSLASLRSWTLSGEPLEPDLLRQLQQAFRDCTFLNLYGSSEVAADATYYVGTEDDIARVPIGRPIGNTQVYILDRHCEPVPIDVTGEIYVSGPGVARGYLNRPQLTADVFMPDPFSADAGQRMYRTGDLGRWRADGSIEYLGRTDRQVKIRGHRIELGEIEAQLRRHASVRDAVVLARDDAGEKKLVAYVVSHAGFQASLVDLRASMKAALPEHMVPAALIPLDHLPLNPHGKIDRAALPAPDASAYGTTSFEAPRGAVEETLAAIWSQLLQVERVGRNDGFFDLGGHSLLAMRVLSHVKDGLSVEISPLVMFARPTIAQLAEAVVAAKRVGQISKPPLLPQTRANRVPMSYAQERLWFLDQLGLVGAAYNVPAALRLAGQLDPAALERSFAQLVARHEVLRTRFEMHDGTPVQVIEPVGAPGVEVLDLSAIAEPQRTQEVLRLSQEEANRVFDLTKGPLCRVRVLRLSGEEHVLLVTMHHIISDGWSMGVMTRELSDLYSADVRGESLSLSPLPVQYADYAVWQRKWLQGHELDRQLAYWKDRLAAAPPILQLPTDRPRPAVSSYRGGTVAFVLPADLSRKLAELGRQENATLFMVLLTAFQLLLARLTGQTDIVVGSPIAGRTHRKTEELIGFFVNVLALRTQVQEGQSFRQLLASVRETALEAYAHQDLPFEKLVAELQPQRDLSKQPLIQALCVLQNLPTARDTGAPLKLTAHPVLDTQTSKFDLSLYVSETPLGLAARFEYATDLFEPETIERWAGHLTTLLEGVAKDADCRISELPVLRETERLRILGEFNQTTQALPEDELLHEWLDAQARRTPEAIAVVCESETLNFRELNQRANRLACYLREEGCAPDSLVGIYMERSAATIVALLGVWKAGAAYVPFDPLSPRSRLERMIRDAAPRVLLTQEHLKARLPGNDIPVIALDSEWHTYLEQVDQAPRDTGVTAEHLAYVLFTSGSTGVPKAVMVTHGNIVSFMRYWADWVSQGVKGHSPRASVWTAVTFDVSLLEMFGPLVLGGSIHLVPEGIRADFERWFEWLVDHRITLAYLPPFFLRQLRSLSSAAIGRLALRDVLVSVEPSNEADLFRLQSQKPGLRIINGYGPTETTVLCTTYRDIRNIDRYTPIGGPLWNTRAYVLDPNLRPVPIGVAGELYIGGAGVARGYLNRPELTADRFLLDPFTPTLGARMYRTGDLGRWAANGTLQFMGRNDDQIKLNGHRVELGEIQAVLTAHAPIADAAVLVMGDGPDDKQLVAYVAAPRERLRAAAPSLREAEDELVQDWERLYDSTYESSAEDVAPSFVGWQSSYTGLPMPESQMREWLECTASAILAFEPRSVLEIGCGVGLVLQKLARHVEAYTGTDLSRAAVSRLRRWVASQSAFSHVSLRAQPAHDYSGIEPGSIDTIVLNSVVQYFPDIEYLLSVLESGLRLVQNGGRIFVGDVRNFDLLRVFHCSVQSALAPEGATVEQLRRLVHRAMEQDKELALSPAFFQALPERFPEISGVEIRLKGGESHNELTSYRYDVILHVRAAVPDLTGGVEYPADTARDAMSIEAFLEHHQPPVLQVRSVPNLRVSQEVSLSMLLDDHEGRDFVQVLRERLATSPVGGEDPASFESLGQSLGYEARITFSPGRHDGSFDVTFFDPRHVRRVEPSARQGGVEAPVINWRKYGNDPLLERHRSQLYETLRASLKAQLPEHMIPGAIVILEALPITTGGKLDRRALPLPGSPRTAAIRYEAPRSALEEALVGIWSNVLKVDRIGVHDNFFELGGHSLSAMRVVAHVRESLCTDLSARALFETPTIATLAERIELLERAVPDARLMDLGDKPEELERALAQMSEAELDLLLQQAKA